jgi:hypothetical protein
MGRESGSFFIQPLFAVFSFMSGIRESNPRFNLGKVVYCHCTNPLGRFYYTFVVSFGKFI